MQTLNSELISTPVRNRIHEGQIVKPRILIIDGEESVIDQIRSVMEFDYEILTAAKEEEARQIFAEKKPAEFMSFKHLGVVKDGVEDTTSDEVKQWAGAEENYSLKPVNGNTELTVQIDINDEWKDYFVTTFPKALDKVKELAEKN